MQDAHFDHWPAGVPKTLPELPASPYSSLRDIAARYPARVAINYYGAEITYDRLRHEVEALARHLTGAGIAPGDRVLLWLQNAPQFIIGFYAISAAGAVVVPVNPMNVFDEIAYLAKDTGATLIIAGQERLDDLGRLADGTLSNFVVAAYSDYLPDTPPAGLPAEVTAPAQPVDGPGMVTWAAALRSTGAADLPAPDPAAPSTMPYTSGTTGNPKGCVHVNRSTMTTAVASTLWLGFTEATVQLVTLPLFHVTGMHICMIGGLMRGGTLHLMTRWNRDLAIDLIEGNRATTWIAISAMVIDVVNADGLDRRDLSSLAMIMGGGAAMPEAVAARLHDLTGLDYIEGYGLSETSAPVMINPPQAPRRGCLGIPLMEVDARIIDVDTLQELPPGETGEIIVSAPQVFQGYWQRPEASAEAFITLDGASFLRTGDLGYCDRDGYFYMVDRLKRMINAAGYKVWPTEVESILFRHPGIREACIIAVPDDRRGETVRAVVVRRPGHDGLDEAAIIAWCRDRMAAYKLPRSVVFVDELPKSGTGKVMWRQIQDREWA